VLEIEVAALLARSAAIYPAGFARIDAAALAAAPAEIGLRALSAVLVMVSGAAYPPRGERLERLHRRLAGGLGGGCTLGGCRILPRRGGVLVCREAAAMGPPVAARPGRAVTWDGRFRLRLPAGAPQGLRLGGCGTSGVEIGNRRLPSAARLGAALLRDDTGDVAAAPVLGSGQLGTGSLLFRPRRPLTGAGFTVV
jgi:tRNA(Ile)-lysidine synthase